MGEVRKIQDGDSGAVAAGLIDAVREYDFVVENQADMDTLSTYTGGNYKNILIKTSVNLSASLTRANIGFRRIVCLPGVVITAEDIVGAVFEGTAKTKDDLFLGGTIDITMNAGTAGTYTGISNMKNIYNTEITADPYEDSSLAFTGMLQCDNIYGANIFQYNFGGDCYGYRGCNGVFNCKALTLDDSGYDGVDFYQCTGVVFPTSLGSTDFSSSTGTLANTSL